MENIFVSNKCLRAVVAVGALAAGWPAAARNAASNAASAAEGNAGNGKRPNIIYIMTDQQWAEAMSCAGNPDLQTPNMDRLARNGVRFTNAYCSFPLSGPSRGAMFTGYMPCESGINENDIPIPDSLATNTLGTLMSDGGYECIYAGKWHVNTVSLPGEEAFGFLNIKDNGDQGLAEACVDWLQNHSVSSSDSKGGKSRKAASSSTESQSDSTDKPFFLVASFTNPHNICEFARGQKTPHATVPPTATEDCPNQPANFAGSPYDASVLRYEQSQSYSLYPTTSYTADDWRQYRNAYCRLVEAVDAEIGKIIDEIDRQNLWENTVVIFTSDHGDGTGAHHWNQKTALYEEVVNIPLIVCLPGKENAGTLSNALVSNGIDLMPTVCDWGEVAVPAGRSGRSFRSAAENPVTYDWTDPAATASATTDHSTGMNSAAAPTEDYIVIETNFNQTSGTVGWIVRTPRYKYVLYDKGQHREQLFDMSEDRREMRNLAVEAKYDSILKQHRELLRTWLGQRFQTDARCFRFLPE